MSVRGIELGFKYKSLVLGSHDGSAMLKDPHCTMSTAFSLLRPSGWEGSPRYSLRKPPIKG